MGDENGEFPQAEEASRVSPDSFAVPGVSEFAPAQPPQDAPWDKALTTEDISFMQQLGSLTTSGLIMEVKKLHDLAYQLGLEEAKEMTRGKYLNIFSRRQR
ncbi:hypothetical protein JYU34_013461 [Plutella xylostella]|uniref:Protein lin-52 homolog n=1 Tax=Plutella xylostella TaxID=51655 RepID=A0ABQ7QA02_PLUXY|nr:hypothetical protein JYU34_013461 [Plutella xylostella]